ncbi:MAG: RHS repeat-associated core domain-containing protein [Gaiellaceae bacterium]
MNCAVASSWISGGCPAAGSASLFEDYTYDGLSRLQNYAKYSSGTLSDSTNYFYDALNRVVREVELHGTTTTSTDTEYQGDSTAVTKETGWTQAQSGNPNSWEKAYAYDAYGEALTVAYSPPGGGAALRYSYLYDPGSSISMLLDYSSGAAKESYGYSAYGSKNASISKSAAGFDTTTNPFRFQGKRWDTGSSTYDMGARRYSPATGRWLQQDSYADALDNLGLSQDPLTANRYAFLGANPVNYVEVDGHQGCSWYNAVCGVSHWGRGVYHGGRDSARALAAWRHPVSASKATYNAVRHPVRTMDAFALASRNEERQGGKAQSSGYNAGVLAAVIFGSKGTKAAGRVARNAVRVRAASVTAGETGVLDGSVFGRYRPNRPLPRGKHGNPIPDSPADHTQLGTRYGEKNGPYTQGLEWRNGRPTKRIDFTDHVDPRGHPNPHQHRLDHSHGSPGKPGKPDRLTW